MTVSAFQSDIFNTQSAAESLYENNITVDEGLNANVILIYRITSGTHVEMWVGQMSAVHI